MAALTLPRAVAQDSLNAEQQALRSELYDFLKGEGYLRRHQELHVPP